MNDIILSVLKYLIFLIVQGVVVAGAVSFIIISRVSRDRLFSRYGASAVFKTLYRGRLHLITALTIMEIVIIVILSVILPQAADRILPMASRHAILPALILIFLIATIMAAGLASAKPASYAYFLSYPLLPVYFVFMPVTELFLRSINRIFPKLSKEFSSPLFVFTESADSEEGFIKKNGTHLVRSVVEFGEKKVREVMVPRIDIFSLESHMELEEIRNMVTEKGHSRVPVYEGSVDNIIGILFVKDLVSIQGEEENLDLKSLLREAYYVPEGKKIDDLLREFQRQKKHMAIVVDEYGGTSGIVTLEDILEEIVGEIRDEDDVEGPLIRKMGKREYSVKGMTNIGDLNEKLNISIPSQEADTLGGFLYAQIGRVPLEGETISYKGIDFKIEYLKAQRIIDVLVELPPDCEVGAEEEL